MTILLIFLAVGITFGFVLSELRAERRDEFRQILAVINRGLTVRVIYKKPKTKITNSKAPQGIHAAIPQYEPKFKAGKLFGPGEHNDEVNQ